MNGNFIENFVMGIAQTIHNIGVFVGWITSGVDEADRLAIAANGNFAEKFILLIADVINGIKEAVKWFGNLIEKSLSSILLALAKHHRWHRKRHR